MRIITKNEDVQIQTPKYWSLNNSSSYEEVYLWEVGYQYLGVIEDTIHLLKNINTNEIFKVTNSVFNYLLFVGEGINNY